MNAQVFQNGGCSCFRFSLLRGNQLVIYIYIFEPFINYKNYEISSI